MTGKDLIELIEENELENYDVNIFTKEDERFELNSLTINPSKNTVAFGNE
ncbi:hypothetical protein GCM10008931_44310 [Oceanobacillus oncorhynchi subsp. oncorhynchi]